MEGEFTASTGHIYTASASNLLLRGDIQTWEAEFTVELVIWQQSTRTIMILQTFLRQDAPLPSERLRYPGEEDAGTCLLSKIEVGVAQPVVVDLELEDAVHVRNQEGRREVALDTISNAQIVTKSQITPMTICRSLPRR